MLIAEIISSGTEICQGRYADTNAQFLSAQLTAYGVKVAWHSTTLDEPDLLRDTLERATDRADLVIMTGGLGPTEDDLTRQILADLAGCPLREDSETVARIEARFRHLGRPTNPSNRSQARVPSAATILPNDWGTAPGLMLSVSRVGDRPPSTLIALPGPPRELLPMFDHSVRPLLEGTWGLRTTARILDIHTIFRAESELNEIIRDLFRTDPRVTVALLAKMGQVDVRLTCRCSDENERDAALGALAEAVRKRVGEPDIYGYDGDSLESVVGALLARRGMTIAVAESCTGGLIAKRLTDLSGSSAWFHEGFITYSNGAKTRRLGVDDALLARHGAVSEPVARSMAEGARRLAGATLGLGVTGIAGPTGGTADKPVGMVCVALATPDGTHADTTVYLGERPHVRFQAANRALDMARRWLGPGLV